MTALIEVEGWAGALEQLVAGLAPRFFREAGWRRALNYLRGLLAPLDGHFDRLACAERSRRQGASRRKSGSAKPHRGSEGCRPGLVGPIPGGGRCLIVRSKGHFHDRARRRSYATCKFRTRCAARHVVRRLSQSVARPLRGPRGAGAK